jgi:hypothetical protein
MPITLDLEKNPKQTQFFCDVMEQCARHDNGQGDGADALRYWFYGGAIRGGKTFITLGILVFLCKMYRGSRWHVVRKSSVDLKQTTIPSLEKIVKHAQVRWKRADAEYYCEFEGGSRIYFMSENYAQDKDHNRFKGLETNGILLEQLEELQESMYQTCLQRIGSWYDCEKMPPAFMFATFNPTYNWVKKKLHDKWEAHGADAPFYYLQALPDDNGFVTTDQWRAWEQLDTESYNRFIKGSWDIEIKGVFLSEFSSKNIGTAHMEKSEAIWLSFDFNVDPMTCTVWQTDSMTWARCIGEYRQPNSDIYQLCEQIREDYDMTWQVYVTGDASGSNRSPAIRHQLNHYDIIRQELMLPKRAFKVPKTNPTISQSRTFCNSVFKSMPELTIDRTCKHLIDDCRFVQVHLDGGGNVAIKKTGMNQYANIDNKQLGHLLDTMRYFLHSALGGYVKIPKS